MKILVIQQKMIGDVLASSIICNNLKMLYPKAQIDYLIYPFAKPAVENNPNIDNLILFKDEYRSSKKALLNFLLTIKKSRYDLVVDAYGKLESNLVVAFSGAKTKIGFHKSYSKFLYSKTVKEIKEPLTSAGTALENRLNLVKAISDSTDFDIRPKIYLTSEEIENGKRLLQQHNIDLSKKIFMICVIGSGKNKTYPAEYMANLLDVIVQETKATLLFNYMSNQLTDAQKIFDLCQQETQEHIKMDVIPGTIREFLAVTNEVDAMIGNEGGAINMAKGLNIPTFTIFSTWIRKEAWNSFDDGIQNASVHLKDFKPELYGETSPKDMKKEAMNLYEKFTPDLIIPALKKYLRR